jgi:hypothetical protein
MGIVNSSNTTSASKVMGLKEEREAFTKELKEVFHTLGKPIMALRKAINYDE